ncbi:2Fe-2S iron-sulfur cluster-binding protein [Sulfitobacter aestuarii]|uniref:2Fe-2S iron-sulfur cluster-binding protein n=1 Tax=Sulfitobacter aestuarii TaxID=2161676 RepID=A0ABW5U1H5_9RHOB
MSSGFRRFRVTDKIRESEIITSFHLEPADGAPLFAARPGQYLTLKLPTPEGSVLKTYSLSGDVTAPGSHRITVKRGGRPVDAAHLPEGVGSCWLHDAVSPGMELEVAAPRGSFVLDEDSERPVLLLGGGVGLTPLVAMAHRLAETERRVWFLQACENGAVQALGDELRELAEASQGRIRNHVIYRNPSDADRASGPGHSVGMIDKALLQSLLPLDDYDVYLCGPTPFMVAMYRLLRELGVTKARIAYEFFGKAASLEVLAEQPQIAPQTASKAPAAIAGLAFLTNPDARAMPEDLPVARGPVKAANDTGQGNDVVFARSGVSAAWNDSANSLLELAEEAGLTPAFSCRAGICNTCRCGLKEGEVRYFEEPLDPPGPGEVLLCCARPEGRVVLDI